MRLVGPFDAFFVLGREVRPKLCGLGAIGQFGTGKGG